MAIQIETVEGDSGFLEFIKFHDRVYEYRSARWPAATALQLMILHGGEPFGVGREVKAFVARDAGEIVARAAAVVDQHYIAHWNERIGHILMFEALPNSRDAVKAMIDEACRWFRSHRIGAIRAGSGLMESPFVIDEYELLPPAIVRQNPGYYHSLLKDAGFETEKGWVDYKIQVTPALVARYQSSLAAARAAGFSIVPLKDANPDLRVRHFTAIWNDAFKKHWSAIPMSEAEVASLFRYFSVSGGFDTSVLAYRGGEPVGVLMVQPASTNEVILAPGRVLHESEKLNWLGIGVHESARGRGVNLAMASYAYLELIKRGAKYLSYTMVLDDNWPSRRTAEKLGAKVCASLVVYRRNLN